MSHSVRLFVTFIVSLILINNRQTVTAMRNENDLFLRQFSSGPRLERRRKVTREAGLSAPGLVASRVPPA
jgi:hypothetical protein